MEQPVNALSQNTLSLQARLIDEEVLELDEAIRALSFDLSNRKRRHDALKELADVVFVCFQLAAASGWDLDDALARVFESNMSKLVDGKPIKDEHGKVLKGPNYLKPTLYDLV